MDARKYEGIRHVAVGQFDRDQRQRLEAATAAVALKPGANTYEQLDIASWIATGNQVVAYLESD